AAKDHAQRVDAEEHIEELEMQVRGLQAEGEIVANLLPPAEPAIGAPHARDHRRRRQRDVVGVVQHDRVQIALVPSSALVGGPVPGFLPCLHRFVPKRRKNTSLAKSNSLPTSIVGIVIVAATTRRHAMTIGEFLKRSQRRLVVCLPDDTLNAVAMPVCQLATRMLGIISERDLVRAFARTDLNELQYLRARDLMTTRVVSCAPDDTMRSAHRLMLNNHFRHLPVVKDENLLGMLSIRDTLALRLQESEAETNVLRDLVAGSQFAA